MAWGLEEVYYLGASLFQVLLAYLIVRSGRRRTIRTAFGVVIGLSAIQTLNLLTRNLGQFYIPAGPRKFLDTAILLTLAYLMAQFPRPLGGKRGARISRRLWLGSLVTWGIASQVLAVTLGVESGLWKLGRNVFHEGAFALTAGLFALHFAPGWFDTEPGPLRTQALFAGAGLAVSPVEFGFTKLWGADFPGAILQNSLGGVFHDLVTWFALAGIARILYRTLQNRDPEAWILSALVLAAAGLGIHRSVQTISGPLEMAAHIFRPLLFAVALLRFELVDVPARERRWAVPVSAVAFGALAFVMVLGVLSPTGLDAQSIAPARALIAVVLVGGLAWVSRGSLQEELTPDSSGEERGRVLERYRLALEKAGGSNGELEELQDELGISDTEHELLSAVVEEGYVVGVDELRAAQPGDEIAARYRVQRELGRGGAGRALAAWDEEADRTVVLKEVLRPWEEDADCRRDALEREAQLAAGLDAEGLASVIDLVDTGRRLYLVREHVPGTPLDELVEDQGPLEPEQVARIGAQLAGSLAHLHDRGLLHLDLKPGNVVLDEEGLPVVIDHGTVQDHPENGAGGEASARATRTLDGSGSPQVGTLAWMAPEQVLAEAVDERTDLFALGALLYYLSTGRTHVEIEGQASYAIEDAIVRGSPPKDAPGPIAEAVTACLARDPDKRPAEARELAARLETASVVDRR